MLGDLNVEVAIKTGSTQGWQKGGGGLGQLDTVPNHASSKKIEIL